MGTWQQVDLNAGCEEFHSLLCWPCLIFFNDLSCFNLLRHLVPCFYSIFISYYLKKINEAVVFLKSEILGMGACCETEAADSPKHFKCRPLPKFRRTSRKRDADL